MYPPTVAPIKISDRITAKTVKVSLARLAFSGSLGGLGGLFSDLPVLIAVRLDLLFLAALHGRQSGKGVLRLRRGLLLLAGLLLFGLGLVRLCLLRRFFGGLGYPAASGGRLLDFPAGAAALHRLLVREGTVTLVVQQPVQIVQILRSPETAVIVPEIAQILKLVVVYHVSSPALFIFCL